MNTRIINPINAILLLVTLFSLISCGAKEEPQMALSGTIDISMVKEHVDSPIMVLLVKTDDIERLETESDKVIISLISVDKRDLSFRFDLSDKNLKKGESISIIAYMDINNTGGTPFPGKGDYIGIYTSKKSTLSLGYKLKDGSNSGIRIVINREVFDFDATITGKATDDLTGDLTLIAYAGDFRSSDFSDIDVDQVIGYTRISKDAPGPIDYRLKVLPYGKNLPIQNAFVFAILDVNRNGDIDGGDRVGYYTTAENELPTALTIEGDMADIPIGFHLDATDPSGRAITLSGKITGPEALKTSNAPVFIIVMKGDTLDDMLDRPLSSIKYFEKLPQGTTDYTIDLSETDLLPGETVTVVALWDKNFIAGFPDEDPGDMVGFYVDEEALSASYTLQEGENKTIDIDINREVFDFEASLSGSVTGPETGDLTLILYTGPFNSSAPEDIDFNKVIGYKKVTKTDASPLNFKMKVMPYGENLPIENAFLMGFLDVNKNGEIDGGDRVGYYTTAENELPTPITLAGEMENVTIRFYMDVAHPSGDTIILNGNAVVPSAYGEGEAPLFILVAKGDDLEALLTHPASAIKYFQKLPKGETGFSIDLSQTGLKSGDDIMVIALWDKNFSVGFPNPDKGDLIGFYSSNEKMKAAYSINSGVNSGVFIHVNREIFDFEATVEGTITGPETGYLTLIAYNGPIVSSDFSELDFNAIVGYTRVAKKSDALDFKMRLLPFGQDLPLKDVFIFAMLDVNKNDAIDGGDRIGYYTITANSLPTAMEITSSVQDVDMAFHMSVAEPSGHAMILSGNAAMPEGYDDSSPPLFVMVAEGNSIDRLMADPASSIKYFRKLAPGESAFSIDLSKTDIAPGEDIMIVTLWDRNYRNGFPYPDPGDVIGYYINTKRFSATYRPMAGDNKGIAIDVNREIYDFDAAITGKVLGSDEGNLTLVAYTGDFPSSDFSSIDFNEICGYATLAKGKTSLDYAMRILPYGKNLPIKNAYILALLDVNQNGEIDGGDRIGYYSNSDEGLPTAVTISGDIASADIRFFMTVGDPSGYAVFLKGNLTIDAAYGKDDSPVFMIVADGSGDMDDFLSSPAARIRYFERLPKGARSFDLDLSRTGIAPGEELMIIALWDRNYNGGFPYPDKGDQIGFFMDPEKLSATKQVPAPDAMDAIRMTADIAVNREVFDFEARVEGTVLGSDSGELTLIAYTGAIDSSDFSTIDTNAIVGFTKMEKGETPLAYSLPILPYGKDLPITNLLIFALLDKNRNGKIDGDDKIGYYANGGKGLPTAITLPASETPLLLKNIDIQFYMTLENPSGFDMSLSGEVSLPNGQNSAAQPVFIFVARNGDMDALMKNPASAMVCFQKIPAGESRFTIDLKKTSLKPQDEIMVVALWDKNYQGGFPNPDLGDRIGFYIDAQKMTTAYTLKNGANTGVMIDINREVFDFEATLSGRVNGALAGELTLIAYTGEILSSDFSQIDFNQVRGYLRATKGSSPLDYQMTILPYGKNLPITDVMLLALLDVNGNGVMDGGDRVGYYSQEENGLPTLFTIEGSRGQMDINFKMTVPQPSGYDIRLNGRLVLPPAYYSGSGPAFILVARSESLESLMADPAASIAYFQRLAPGQDTFALNLSSTDLRPGDEVMMVGLWDRNFQGGFPNPDQGDMVGFYMDREKMSPAYGLSDGLNQGVVIEVNREVFDFDASVSGMVLGSETGTLTMVAYTGEITSSDFSTLDMDHVSGYGKTVKGSAEMPYRVEILPYGKDLPLRNAYMFGLLDVNRNGQTDAGDKIAFHKDAGTGMPKGITIDGHETNIDLTFSMTIPEPSGYAISVRGELRPPAAYYQSGSPLFVIVARGDSMEALMEDPLSSILYFEKLAQGETGFDIDLSQTGLSPGDEILIVGLWDRNFQGGFPNPDLGDMIGFYMDAEKMSPSYRLSEGVNQGIAIDVNREIYDYTATVSGSVSVNGSGDLILIAYAGEPDLQNIMGLDFDKIMGYLKIENTGGGQIDYTMRILPYGEDLPFDTYVFGLLDQNRNGKVDAGDKVGYYTNSVLGLPSQVSLSDQGGGVAEATGIDLTLKRIMYDYDTSISFKIDPRGRPSSLQEGHELIALVVHEGGLAPGLNLPVNTDYVIGFSKIAYSTDPDHEYRFNILDFIYEGINYDEVMNVGVYLFYDRDGDGLPSPQDTIAFYWKDRCFFSICTRQPMLWPLARNTENVLENANNDPSNNPYGVRFWSLLGGLSSNQTIQSSQGDPSTLPGENQSISVEEMRSLLSQWGIDTGAVSSLDDLYQLIRIIAENIDFPDESPDVDTDTPAEPQGGSTGASLLQGRVLLPENSAYPEGAALFILVLDQLPMDQMIAGFGDALKYAQQLPEGVLNFTIDPAEIDLEPGDEVVILALLEKNFDGILPFPDPEDLMGFYQSGGELVSSGILFGEAPETIEISLNRLVSDLMALFEAPSAPGKTMEP